MAVEEENQGLATHFRQRQIEGIRQALPRVTIELRIGHQLSNPSFQPVTQGGNPLRFPLTQPTGSKIAGLTKSDDSRHVLGA